MISKKTKYAFLALTYLAKKSGSLTTTQTIADETHIPKKFLENILIELRNAGLVRSKLGKGGGMYLQKKPEEITLAHVYRLISGPIAMLPCVSLNFYEKCKDCKTEKGCGLNKIMISVRDSTLEILEKQTIQDVADSEFNF